MSTVTQDQVIAYIANLKLGEVADLIATLEETLGVSASTIAQPVAAAYGVPITDPEPQTDFSVILDGFTGKKVDVIKIVRKELGLGLKESKALVESAPTVLREEVDRDAANALRAAVEAVGGQVTIR